MEFKTAAISLGIGMVAGAAAVMLLPKQSKPYQVASTVADTIKSGVTQVGSAMQGN